MEPTPDLIAFLRKIHLFNGLEDDAVRSFAEQCNLRECAAGEVIVQQGTVGDSFFIIAKGSVSISRQIRGNSETLAKLVQGDYFGEESLIRRKRRTATVTAAETSTLLILSRADFKALLKRAPMLKANFSVSVESRRLARRMRFKWLRSNDGEVIYYLARKHKILLLRAVLLPAFLCLVFAALTLYGLFISAILMWVGLVLFLLSLGALLWQWADWGNDYYIVTNQRVVWLEKVVGIYDSREEAPLSAVQRVSVSAELSGRALNYGDLIVRTIVGSSLTLKNVDSPYQAAALVEEQWRRSKETYRKMEEGAMKEALRERLLHPEKIGVSATSESIIQKAQEKKKNPYEGQRGLANLFRVRFEKTNIITYRKHWFVLVRQSWLPGIFVIGLLVILVIGVTNSFSSSTPILSTNQAFLTFIVTWFIFILALGGWWYYQYVDWRNDVFQVTPDQIIDIDKTPLGSMTSDIAALENILNIEYRRQGLIELIFNYGTVYITVGGGKQMAFEDVFNPSEVQADIERRRLERISRMESNKVKAERERMADWFAAYYHSQGDLGISGQSGIDPIK